MDEESLSLLLATLIATGRLEAVHEIIAGCPDPEKRNEMLREQLRELSYELEGFDQDPDIPFLPSDIFDDRTIEAVIDCVSKRMGAVAL